LNINKDISSDQIVSLEVTLSPEETSDDENRNIFSEAVMSFRREAKIPGFRPGRIPLNLVRKRWGKELRLAKAEELAKKFIEKVLDQEKLEPGGQIDVEMIEYGEGNPLAFKIVFPLQPEVNLTKYKGLRVLLNDAEIADSDIDEELEFQRRKQAVIRSIDDPAPAEAKLTLKVQEVDPSGIILVGCPLEEKIVELGTDILGIGSDEQLLGINVGEKRVIKVRLEPGGITKAPVQSAIITPEQAKEGQQVTNERYLSVEVVKVEVLELPELNDDFAKLVDENVESLKTLRDSIKYRMMVFIESVKRRTMENSLIDRLIEENPLQISRAVIEGTLNNVADNLKLEMDSEKRKKFIETSYADAEKDLRYVLLRDEVAKQENIVVTDEEVTNEITRAAEERKITFDEMKKKIEEEGSVDQIKRTMLERRVIDILMTNADIEKRTMEFSEFLRITQESER